MNRILHINTFPDCRARGRAAWPGPAAVYAGRDREVMETGIPIIERIYGFVADRSTSLNCVTVRPVSSASGRRIGTATVYWRARRTKTTDHSVSDIAAETGFFDHSHFIRAFRKATGPQRRLRRARRLWYDWRQRRGTRHGTFVATTPLPLACR